MPRTDTIRGQVFYVADWLVEPLLHQVSRGDVQERLPPKFIQVLQVLAQDAGQVVTREQLLDRVWPDVVVTESVLTRAIFELRKVFGDSAQNPTVIETIPKTGYRLIAPVVWEASAAVRDGQTRIHPDDIVVAPAGTFEQVSVGRSLVWKMGAVSVGFIVLFVAWWLGTQRQPDGRPVQSMPFTSSPGLEFDPAWSPDGQTLAYAGWSLADSSAHIYTRGLEATVPIRLTTGAAWHRSPVWSPDGRFLAYVACTDDGAALYTLPVAGGAAQRLTSINIVNCRWKGKIDWSPDGQWIVYPHIADAETPQTLYRYHVADNTSERLIEPSAEGYDDSDPAFSPDGTELAFVRSDVRMMSQGSIWIADLNTGELRTLTERSFYIDGLDWLPDGGVLFSSRATLWHVAAEGASPTWRYHAGSLIHQLAIAPDGERLAYVRSSFDTNIWRFEIAGLETRPSAAPFIRSNQIDAHPSISPDGSRIAFISDRSGACGVWLRDIEVSQAVEVATVAEDCMSVETPHWTWDGRYLALVVVHEEQHDIFVVDTAVGTLRQVTDTPDEEVAPHWSRDGRTLYFASRRSGQWEVWQQNVQGGEATPLTTNGGFVAQEGPDQMVYYTKPAQVGIWQRSLVDQTDEQLLPGLQPDDAINWRVTDTGIYFLLRLRATALAYYDFATGTASLVAQVPPELDAGGAITLAPNGQWGLFAHVDQDDEDIILMDVPIGR